MTHRHSNYESSAALFSLSGVSLVVSLAFYIPANGDYDLIFPETACDVDSCAGRRTCLDSTCTWGASGSYCDNDPTYIKGSGMKSCHPWEKWECLVKSSTKKSPCNREYYCVCEPQPDMSLKCVNSEALPIDAEWNEEKECSGDRPKDG